jgi:hypothetical protein
MATGFMDYFECSRKALVSTAGCCFSGSVFKKVIGSGNVGVSGYSGAARKESSATRLRLFIVV